MKSAIVTIFTILGLLSSLATTFPLYETNSQRLARGLPPLRPRFRRYLPGYQARDAASPVNEAKRSSPSPSSTPVKRFTGRIQVVSDTGSALGFVRNSPGAETISGVNAVGPDHDLHVKFFTTPSGKGPFDIVATNPTFPAPFFVGAAGTSFVNSISADSANTLAFTNVEQTPAGALPTPSTSNRFVESAIWSFHPYNKELTAQYINPDGMKYPTFISYDIRANRLFFVGNITLYNEQHVDTPASVVTLHFVSD